MCKASSTVVKGGCSVGGQGTGPQTAQRRTPPHAARRPPARAQATADILCCGSRRGVLGPHRETEIARLERELEARGWRRVSAHERVGWGRTARSQGPFSSASTKAVLPLASPSFRPPWKQQASHHGCCVRSPCRQGQRRPCGPQAGEAIGRLPLWGGLLSINSGCGDLGHPVVRRSARRAVGGLQQRPPSGRGWSPATSWRAMRHPQLWIAPGQPTKPATWSSRAPGRADTSHPHPHSPPPFPAVRLWRVHRLQEHQHARPGPG
jgi:hypothetical protein